MIYISAQPDKLYFLWQLEIQLYHFSKLGIKPEHIQVLIGYKPEKGLHKAFQKLIEEKKEIAQFFTYPDTCKSSKHANCIETSYGGCCFIDRAIYQSCGLENEHFKTWGPDDIERAKRIQILGYQLKRVAGPLFHLNHYRGRSSTPPPHQIFENDLEYIKICNFRRPELEKYISTWKWAHIG